MFDIGWGELLVIGVVALIAIGPKELPGVLRQVGQWTGKIRRMAGEFQNQFQEALREAEMADLKKQVDELNDAARGLTTQFDPLEYDSKKWQSQPAAPGPTTPAAAPSDPSPETPPVPPEATPTEFSAAAPQPQPPATELSAPAPQPEPPATGKDVVEAPPSAPEHGTRPA